MKELILAFCRKHINYIAVFVCGCAIYYPYYTSPILGHTDAPEMLIGMNVSWQSGQFLSVPKWQMFVMKGSGGCGGYWTPHFPQMCPTMLLCQFLDFVTWVKLHQFLLMLFGSLGVIAFVQYHGGSGLWPAIAGIIAMFSGAQIEHSVLTCNSWGSTVGFIPWILLCIDCRKWKTMSALLFVFFSCGTLHSSMFVLGVATVYATMCGIRAFSYFLIYLAIGLLLSCIFVLPIIVNGSSNTIGRAADASRWITTGWFDVRHFIMSMLSRHNTCLWWPEQGPTPEYQTPLGTYSAYIGIVAMLGVIIGMAVSFYRRNICGMKCSIISAAIFICCCGSVWIMLSGLPIIGGLVRINATTTRMIMPMMVVASCAMGIGMSRIKLPMFLSIATLMYLTIDYSQMMANYCARSQESMGWATKDYAEKIKVRPDITGKRLLGCRVHEIIPGDSIYLDIVSQNGSITLPNCAGTFSKNLVMKDVMRDTIIHCDTNATFLIPSTTGRMVQNGLYRIMFVNSCWTWSRNISVVSMIIFLIFVFRQKFDFSARKCYNSSTRR